MGEQQSGGGSPGRRRVHPDGVAFGTGPGNQAGHTADRASAPAVVFDDAALEALLFAAVLRGYRVDSEGEQRAVAAFRAARDAGVHRARTRRRDDWRPRNRRRLALSLKTTLSLFAASLTLGGVAFAAIGSSDSSDNPADDKGRPTPSATGPDRPATGPSSATSGRASGRDGHPATAQDTEARCRAYDQVKGSGQALDATAWQRLTAAAGGADKVAAYCAEQLAAAKSRPTRQADGSSATTGNGATGGGSTGNGDTGNGSTGNDATGSGQEAGGGDKASGGSAGSTGSAGGAESTESAEKSGKKN
ncbi:hypothetical protein [Streptomyces sp. HD]|uniref:hypothetical protein n=1 Tax=Streptomyces sp. HD TaxID=3020892 RepID=UPI0023305CD3|nr:hypothetical protein [Streptomyces sp. HD]MDC0765934.1 hypothetical protein [Streptomyces sp. HD]